MVIRFFSGFGAHRRRAYAGVSPLDASFVPEQYIGFAQHNIQKFAPMEKPS
jgi:hypothetical protein